MNKRINVTKSYLPPKEEYFELISRIWDNHYLTNYGPLQNELVEKLESYLNVKNLHITNNGTISLQLSLDALDCEDGAEVITTPFTFVATSSSIAWQKLKPVFVDIDRDTFNIDPKKIEAAITDKTVAIMAVHCFGIPCDVKAIEKIAKKHKLTVIYDAAHSFGTKIGDKSVLSFGDIVSCSLHATKVYHSIEGGLVICNNDKFQKKINATKNFGNENGEYKYVGINAKNSEFHSAMGLCVLNHLDEIIEARKKNYELYSKCLEGVVEIPVLPEGLTYNYIYYPVLFKNEEELLKVIDSLSTLNVGIRRYFYPALNELDIFENKGETPIASDVSSRIACLPLDTYLEKEDIEFICNEIKKTINEK